MALRSPARRPYVVPVLRARRRTAWALRRGEGQTDARRIDAGLIGARAIALMTAPGRVCQFSDNRGFFATAAGSGWMYGRMVIFSPVVLEERGMANRLFRRCSIPQKPLVGLPAACRHGRMRFPPWGECGMWAQPSYGQYVTFICKMLLLCPAAARGVADGSNPSGAVMSGSFGFEYRSTVSGRVQTVGNGPAGVRAGRRNVPPTGLVPTDRQLACIAVPLSVSCTAPYAGLFRGRF